MIRRELHIMASALLYFTRIPLPFKVPYNKDYMVRVLTWFPGVGLIVAMFGILLWWLTSQLLPQNVARIIALAGMVVLTGALHEDGWADVCDGFGGGYNAQRRLEIMKDSCIGAFGAIGLLLLFLLKSVALLTIPVSVMIPALLLAHATSRLSSLTIAQIWNNARHDASSKSKDVVQRLSWLRILLACGQAAVPVVMFQNIGVACLVPVQLMLALLGGRFFKKRIGGYTGDCLGAVQQLNEVLAYLWICGVYCK